ncbi:PspC domain-containing protein [Providencia huaxiensis]
MTQFRGRKLYRLTDRRVFGGVCSGIAEYLELPVALVRALAVLALFVSFGITLILYIVMCFVVETAPSGYRSEQDIEH